MIISVLLYLFFYILIYFNIFFNSFAAPLILLILYVMDLPTEARNKTDEKH